MSSLLVTVPTTAQPGSSSTAVDVGALLHGRYRLTGKLGSGGMADVFLADDERLGRQVAVKVLRRRFDGEDKQLVRRFQVEAKAAAMLSHPAVVAVFDQGREGDHWYLVMEYVRGETLKQPIRREGPLPVGQAAAIVRQVLGALAAAHARRVVHRDVTSQNVLLAAGGGAKVADFGIARIGAPDLTRTGTMLGTCHYLSPEQAQGRAADARSDLYSAGVVLFEALTGSLPFEGDSEVAVALKQVREPAPAPSSLAAGVPVVLDQAVLTALAKDPAQRFQTAEAFAAALAQVGSSAGPPVPTAGAPGTQGRAAPPPQPTRFARRRSRRRLVLVVVLTLVAALAVAAAVLFTYLSSGVAVPRVVGLSEAKAKARVRASGLRAVTHRAYIDGVDADVVARQRPAKGELDKEATADLWVSRGPLHVAAPALRGLTSAQARRSLADAGLPGDARKTRSATVAAGHVAHQEPKAGGTLTRGQTVKYWVSAGLPLVEVLDVVGLSSGDAGAALEDAGFTVNVDLVAGLGSVPGDVVEQDPAAGTKLGHGAEVTIKVAIF